MQTQIIRTPTFQRPSGRLYLDSILYNISNNTPTLVPCDAGSNYYSDDVEIPGSFRITPGKAGLYIIHYSIRYVASSQVADKPYEAHVYVSGVSVDYDRKVAVDTTWGAKPHGSCLRILTASDYVQLYAKHNAGVDTVDVATGEFDTFIDVQRVR